MCVRLLVDVRLSVQFGRTFGFEVVDAVMLFAGGEASYATVNGEVIDEGTFQITSYDKTEGQTYCTNCNGTFTLQFSEGTLNGTFCIK